jgi:hypothetical protein
MAVRLLTILREAGARGCGGATICYRLYRERSRFSLKIGIAEPLTA